MSVPGNLASSAGHPLGLTVALHNSASRSIHFETTGVAAPALPPVRDQRHVADLPCHPVGALPYLVVQDDPSANARTERQQDHATDAASSTAPLFSKGCRIGIVLDHNRNLERILQFFPEWKIVPIREIRRFHHNALVHPDDAGGTNPDRSNMQTALDCNIALPRNAIYKPGNDFFPTVRCVRFLCMPIENFSIRTEKRASLSSCRQGLRRSPHGPRRTLRCSRKNFRYSSN